MAKGQEQNVTQRRVVATLEDQNKYAMPDGRRLRVFAEPLRMNVEAEIPDSVRLADALAKVNPAMNEFLAERLAEDQATAFKQGTALAIAGEESPMDKGEWTKRGYDSYKGYLEGERLSDQLDADWQQAPKDLNTDFDTWYKDWWAEKSQGLNMNSEYFRSKFDSAFMKGLAQTKAKHIDYQAKLQVQENEDVIVGTIYNTIRELRQPKEGTALDFSIYDVEALQRDMKLNLAGVTPQRLDELTYQTALMYAEKYDDPKVLETFFMKHSDGTPALADKKLNDGKRWGEKIQEDMDRIAVKSLQRDALIEKREKEVKDKKRFEIYSKFIQDENMTTDAINAMTRKMLEQGLFTSLSEASSEVNQLFNLKKKDETQAQQTNSLSLLAEITSGKPINEQYVIQAFKKELISSSGAKEAFSAIAKRKEHLEKLAKEDINAAKQRGMMYKDRSYTIGEGILKNAIVIPNLPANALPEEVEKRDAALKMRGELLRTYASKALVAKDAGDFLNLANELVDRYNATTQTGSKVAPPAGAEAYK